MPTTVASSENNVEAGLYPAARVEGKRPEARQTGDQLPGLGAALSSFSQSAQQRSRSPVFGAVVGAASTVEQPDCSVSGSSYRAGNGLDMLLQASRSNSSDGDTDSRPSSNGSLHMPAMETEPASQLEPNFPMMQVQDIAAEAHRSKSSILILGMAGVGKSTLAVIAANQLECPLIDTDRTLAHRFQMPVTTFIKEHGEQKFRELEAKLLREIITSLSTSAQPRQHVVACGGGICDWQGNRDLIRAFRDGGGKVIHVHRDKTVVVPSLRHSSSIVFGNDEARIRDLWHARTPLWEEVASHTFVNLSVDTISPHSSSKHISPALALKPVERDFLRFLTYILASKPGLPFLEHSSGPSYLLRIDNFKPHALDGHTLRKAIRGAAAIELCLQHLVSGFSPPPTPHAGGDILQHLTAAHAVAYLRRHTDLPIFCTLYSQGIGGITNYRQLGEASYIANVIKAFRLGVDVIAIDGQLSEQGLTAIQTARPPTVRLLHDFRLDHAGPADWTPDLVADAANLATSRGADLVRVTTSPVRPTSIFSVAQLQPADTQVSKKPVLLLETTGPFSRSTSLVNRHLTPIAHPTTSTLHFEDLPTFRDVQQNLLASGLQVPKVIYISQSRRKQRAYSAFEEGLQNLQLPLRLWAQAEAPSKEDAASFSGLLADGKLPVLSAKASTEAARYTGVFRVIRSTPLLYDNLYPAALAETIDSGLSPVNAVTSSSVALVIGAQGTYLLEIVYALWLKRVHNVYLLSCGELPESRAYPPNVQVRNIHSSEDIGRQKPSIAIICDRDAWLSITDESHILASPTGGCAVDLSHPADRHSGKTSSSFPVPPGWTLSTQDDVIATQVKLEFAFLTSFHPPAPA